MTRSLALALSVVAALVGAALVFLYVQSYENEVSGGVPVEVLVATKDIALGATLSDENVGTHFIPSKYVEERHIPASEGQRLIGVRVSSRIKAQESILWSDLATTSDKSRDLSALVEPGKRAVTVRADVATLGQLIRPGDRVDILITSVDEYRQPLTKVMLQRLLVLAVGTDTGRGDAIGRGGQVTLSANMHEAEVLATGANVGALALVLRNPDDIQLLENVPAVTRDQVLGIVRAPAPRPAPPRREEPTGPTPIR